MSIAIKVPPVGESITEVTISQWFKQSGDMVSQDEPICELESDKAAFELPSEATGILTVLVAEGETVAVGTVVASIAPATASTATAQKPVAASAIASTPTQQKFEQTSNTVKETREIRVVPFGESITEVTIGTWLKSDGDFVALDEPMVEIETDKATQEFPAEVAGILRIVAQEGDVLAIGDLICKIEVTDEVPADSGKTADTPAPVAQTASAGSTSATSSHAAGHPSPAAAKILSEKGVSPSDVSGTGVGGRITKQDAVEAKASTPANNGSAGTASTNQAPAAPAAQGGSRNQRRERMSALRKTIARRLVSVKNETAMLTTFNEVNMQPIMDMRKKYKDLFKDKHEVGLGFMSFFVKACCVALKEFPQVNAMIDETEIVFNDFCDVSIAVSAPRGLVVPVIRNAEMLSFAGIEKTIVELAVKARDNKLTIPEMTGGTFTITNGGIFGSMMSTPIINAPQSAILGMHNIVERVVVENGQMVIRPMMYLALSYDHRIIDGKESVGFLVRVKQLLEAPERLLLEV
ncbi:2-oxoglutarate dehydrogenase complex dihydrolipoyllysine-residue succinyltransferase [Eisenibacter elegans]|uniref:2-oxoglutarate dehydrogenase complex dihydrolipoyllysine-residue succinyltransferase n=1 Tax=Eisenibacter elegans TaxID=997 RepID=UPI0003F7161D|nr:2-oxoglutarate dehydrogenase complex dihydrolipoyllysine-residue succinyltransferase [Eisenibacter elegans]